MTALLPQLLGLKPTPRIAPPVHVIRAHYLTDDTLKQAKPYSPNRTRPSKKTLDACLNAFEHRKPYRIPELGKIMGVFETTARNAVFCLHEDGLVIPCKSQGNTGRRTYWQLPGPDCGPVNVAKKSFPARKTQCAK